MACSVFQSVTNLLSMHTFTVIHRFEIGKILELIREIQKIHNDCIKSASDKNLQTVKNLTLMHLDG
jgi:hypothetical protein